jgi:hypothetical protein
VGDTLYASSFARLVSRVANSSCGGQPHKSHPQAFGPIPSPGTIHECTHHFPEKVHPAIGFKADLPPFVGTLPHGRAVS